ncbi:MAG: hypothetical protein V4795_09635 [Pseudomonadota bacterium]
MLQSLTWAGAAVALLVIGWMASARFHQRRIDVLQLQLKVLRQTMNANTDQARRQIGQLQAELATRPAAPRPEPAPERETPLVDGIRRRPAAPDRFVVLEDGFPQTAVIGGDGFAPTRLMR